MWHASVQHSGYPLMVIVCACTYIQRNIRRMYINVLACKHFNTSIFHWHNDSVKHEKLQIQSVEVAEHCNTCTTYFPLQQVLGLTCHTYNDYRGGTAPHPHWRGGILWLPSQPIIGKSPWQHRQMTFIGQLIGQGICWSSHMQRWSWFAENGAIYIYIYIYVL